MEVFRRTLGSKRPGAGCVGSGRDCGEGHERIDGHGCETKEDCLGKPEHE
jgi:hypothetical protein